MLQFSSEGPAIGLFGGEGTRRRHWVRKAARGTEWETASRFSSVDLSIGLLGGTKRRQDRKEVMEGSVANFQSMFCDRSACGRDEKAG